MRSSAAPSTQGDAGAPLVLEECSHHELTGNVFDIQRFSVHDGPGIRTIVFLKSCPLRCLWCSNPESQGAGPELMYSATRCLRCGTCVKSCESQALQLTEGGIVVDEALCTRCGRCADVCPSRALRMSGYRMTVTQVLTEVERDRVFYEHSGGGMTVSGGEPLMQPDFSAALLHEARSHGIHSAVETAGWADAATVRQVLGAADLILYDIKHMDANKHLAGTGMTNQRIQCNAHLAASLGIPMVVRTPVIPGFNDNMVDILAIGQFVISLGLKEMHLLPYHRYGAPKYASLRRHFTLMELEAPASELLEGMRTELNKLGLVVCIGG